MALHSVTTTLKSEVPTVTSADEKLTWPFERDAACPLDPPPALRDLRERCPVAHVQMYDGLDAMLLTRHADIRALLGADNASADTSRPGFPHASETARSIRMGQRVFARMDAPVHTEHRRMVNRPFLMPRVRELKPRLEALVAEMLDQFQSLPQPADLVADFANRVPSTVIVELLALPLSDSAFFQNRLEVWHSLSSTPAESSQAKRDLTDYLEDAIAGRRLNPGDDLMSQLITEQLDTGNLSLEQLLQILHVLLVGGYETTANMIALGTILLLRHPEQLAALKSDPALWPNAIEELLRYLSVAHQATYRLALADVPIPSGVVPEGTAVIAPVMAANRDPEVFPDPDSLDIRRDSRAHLAFGFGVHQCLGQSLARVELQVVFERLFARLPDLRLAASMASVPYKNSMVYGAESVLVTW
jgi:cytochrome P450